MKKTLINIVALLIFFAACKNADKKNDNKAVLGGDDKQTSESLADTLYQQVIDEHDAGMIGWMKIQGRQKQINGLLDSIAKLPVKTQATLTDITSKLNEANKALSDAYQEMDVWMTGMNLDSAANDLEVRIKYLTAEKIRGSRITQMINSSMQTADSLLKVH